MTTYVGIDLGGTKIAGAVVDVTSGKLAGRKVIPTEGHEGPEAVLRRIAQLARDVCQEAGLSLDAIGGVGLGVPATIDFETGSILLLPNLPGDWYGRPVAGPLREALGCPVWLINDARAFTLAEATLGAGRGAHTVVGFTLGTGIGGGITIGGRLHLGLGGSAGEFGHHTVDVNGPPDGSGNRGTIEAFASGPAIAAMGVKAVMQGLTTKIGELVNYDLNRITPEVIMRAAQAGDAIARDILGTAGAYIGAGVANVIIILSPDCVVIGGGVAQLGDWIMRPIQETIRQRVHTVPLDRLKVVRATLGTDAGVIGAAVWASHQGSMSGATV